MSEESNSKVPELVRQKLEGRSYGEIRAELSASGMSNEEIKLLIRKVDEQVLRKEVEGSKPDRIKRVYYSGLALAIAGLLLALAFNAGMILESLPAFLVYAPFILGILVMLISKRLPRKEEKPAPGSGAIRRQRPFK